METPRPEYPRPDFVREEWFCLNGEWEFSFDDSNVGLDEQWFRCEQLDQKIVVPFCYQSPLSGIGTTDIHEVVWYARNLEIPDASRNRDLLLHFGAVDYETTVWVNGQEAAHNRGGHVPFELDIAPYLKDSDNRIVLRVEDRQDAFQPRGKQALSGIPKGTDYRCTTGIWQTVWLEPAPALRIESIRVYPHLHWFGGDDVFEVRITLHAPASGYRIEAQAMNAEGDIVAQAADTGGASFRVFLQIPEAERWTPDNPYLYDLTVRLHDDGQVLDEVRTYAGMRSIKTRGDRILLNNEPVYLAMALDQGYWPEGIMTAPTDEALRRDIELAKAMGFNGLRKHQKVEDPRWLYWCDRLGMLVWGEMPNARKWSTHAEELFVAEWMRTVLRDMSHPCIVAWVPINESWGVPGLREGHPAQYAFIERIVDLTRLLDPARPVIDNDGWEHTDVGDIAAIHDYTPTGAEIAKRWNDGIPEKIWYKEQLVHFLKGAKYRGQPLVLSEVGGLLMMPPTQENLDRLYTVYASIKTPEELMERYRELITGIASISKVTGFCYTQLTDIQPEINGLLTENREPKVPVEQIAEVNRQAGRL